MFDVLISVLGTGGILLIGDHQDVWGIHAAAA